MLEPSFDVDAVITYVDVSDPLWKQSFIEYSGSINTENNCRYRQWDTLKYIFRGIEQCMPWIRKVHLIVSQPSQVPDWLDTTNEKLNIVYHKDIIPDQLLPTFNTNQIELFLYSIKGLSEHFIYFNDDMFPINLSNKFDFFTYDGKIKMPLKPFYKWNGMMCTMLSNNIAMLCKYQPGFKGYEHPHSAYPLIKSLFSEFINNEYYEILNIFSNSRLRTNKDITLHIISEYCALMHWVENSPISFQYVGLSNRMSFPTDSDASIICFNDTEKLTYAFNIIKSKVNRFLNIKLPNKSSYESVCTGKSK